MRPALAPHRLTGQLHQVDGARDVRVDDMPDIVRSLVKKAVGPDRDQHSPVQGVHLTSLGRRPESIDAPHRSRGQPQSGDFGLSSRKALRCRLNSVRSAATSRSNPPGVNPGCS